MILKALCVGIDYYKSFQPLHGCVNDALSVCDVLSRNDDGTVNFSVKLLTAPNAPDESHLVTRSQLLQDIKDLFHDYSDVALFYFAGHGHLDNTGGYLIPSDGNNADPGLELESILKIATLSKAANKIIILDSCFAGNAGNLPELGDSTVINEGMTILTACGSDQYAGEEHGHGIFTHLLVDALRGGAMNLLGEVTPGSIYAHIDQSLGPWDQRPLFKTNVRNFVCLRKNTPPISLRELQRITEFFPTRDTVYYLDPSYESDSTCSNQVKCGIFRILQNYNRVNLVVPVGAEHMYYAAMNSTSCKLTPLGKHYWNLVHKKRI